MRDLVVIERLLALLLTCFENLFHGAIINGWPSFVFVFIQLGYFSDLCDDDNTTRENTTSSIMPNITASTRNLGGVTGNHVSCPEQASRLQLVFSVAIALQSTSMFPIGFLLDRYGTRLSRLVMSFLMLIGYLMMAFSSSTYSILLFPGTICFTLGSVILLFSSMQIGNLFRGHKSTVITTINAMYSAAVIISVIAKRAHEVGFSINTFFFIMAGSVLLLHINTFLFLPTKFIPWPLPKGYRLTPCSAPRTTHRDREESAYYQNRGDVGDLSNPVIGVTGNYIQIGMDFISREESSKRMPENMLCRQNIGEPMIREIGKEMDQFMTAETGKRIPENGHSRQDGVDPIITETDKEMDQRMSEETGERIADNRHSRQDGVDPIITETDKEMDQRMSEETGKRITEIGDSRQDGVEVSNKEAGEDRDPLMNEETDKTPDDDGDSNIAERKRKEYGSLSSCLLSTPFCLLLLWQAFLQIDLIFTFGTLNSFLTRLADGDEDVVSWYTDVFSIIQFLAVIVGPIGGLLMDRNNIFTSCSTTKKTKVRDPYADMRDSCLPLVITALASIGYSVCVLIPSLQLQYLTFVLLLIVPSLLYGVGPAVVSVVFPMQYFASVYGAIRTICGLFSLLQYPIFIILQTYLDGDPFYVTIGFIIADISTLLLPAALYVKSRRRQAPGATK
eukprot:XP_011683268.1 PREDICTED: solute carrier family 43 member 3 [Strongylocentrotus purpuratus]